MTTNSQGTFHHPAPPWHNDKIPVASCQQRPCQQHVQTWKRGLMAFLRNDCPVVRVRMRTERRLCTRPCGRQSSAGRSGSTSRNIFQVITGASSAMPSRSRHLDHATGGG